jgi:hypothetical protein
VNTRRLQLARRRKKDPVLVALGDCPEKWNVFLLKNYGLPNEPQARNLINESEFTNKDGNRIPLESMAGAQIRLGEEPPRGLAKVRAEYSGLECEASEEWKRSQGFFHVMAQIYAHEHKLPKQQREAMLKMVDELRPGELLVTFASDLGSPENFHYRWEHHEFDVAFESNCRALQRFVITRYVTPAGLDEPEDLDPAGEPKGHWEGLKFVPDRD